MVFKRIVKKTLAREQVGYKNYDNLISVFHQLLKDDGLFLLHTIGNSEDTAIVYPWIEKYIFRNSMAPSMLQLWQIVMSKMGLHHCVHPRVTLQT